jgi:periplasmic protein TonB
VRKIILGYLLFLIAPSVLAQTSPSIQAVEYAVAEQIPQYRFGIEGLQQYLKKRVRYPKEAKKNQVTGTVYVGFVVDSTGVLRDFEVKQGLGSGCDEEAIRALKGTSPWLPGRKEGKPISMQYVVPVTFER